MRNFFIQSASANPWHNLAIEKTLSDAVMPGDMYFYLWQNDHTVVIGRNQSALRECRAQLLEEESGYLARRTTGGGAVYHDLGNLCYTFAASPDRYDVRRQLGVVMEACRSFGIETHFSGRNDLLTADERKFSGSAFSTTKTAKIQHGTLMLSVDTEKLQRYLTPSPLKLKAKGIASVRSRVCNLTDLAPEVTAGAMCRALQAAFEKEYGAAQLLSEGDLPRDVLRQNEDFFSSWDWRYGTSPECETSVAEKFPWGEVEVQLTLRHMRIDQCKVYSDAMDVRFPQAFEQLITGKRFDLSDLEETSFPQSDETLGTQLAEAAKWLGSALE